VDDCKGGLLDGWRDEGVSGGLSGRWEADDYVDEGRIRCIHRGRVAKQRMGQEDALSQYSMIIMCLVPVSLSNFCTSLVTHDLFAVSSTSSSVKVTEFCIPAHLHHVTILKIAFYSW
jgi:hypothetical protein